MNTLLSGGHAYAIVYQVIIVVCGVGIIAGLLALVEHMHSPRGGSTKDGGNKTGGTAGGDASSSNKAAPGASKSKPQIDSSLFHHRYNNDYYLPKQ